MWQPNVCQVGDKKIRRSRETIIFTLISLLLFSFFLTFVLLFPIFPVFLDFLNFSYSSKDHWRPCSRPPWLLCRLMNTRLARQQLLRQDVYLSLPSTLSASELRDHARLDACQLQQCPCQAKPKARLKMLYVDIRTWASEVEGSCSQIYPGLGSRAAESCAVLCPTAK